MPSLIMSIWQAPVGSEKGEGNQLKANPQLPVSEPIRTGKVKLNTPDGAIGEQK